MTAKAFLGERLVIASHNPGKVQEIDELLRPFGIAVVSAGELGLPEPEETGSSFAENAALKAESAAEGAGLAALADDSGLVVPVLDGAPGLYSARWAGSEKDFNQAMEKVNRKLGENPDRHAYFVCALALARPGEETRIFEGRVNGTLLWPPRGALGFGYDPMFQPDGRSESFGEMDPAEKHAISHRARAFRDFETWLRTGD